MKRSRFTEQQIFAILREGDAGGSVTRKLEQLKPWRGLTQVIRCDNGPEIISQTFADWPAEHDI